MRVDFTSVQGRDAAVDAVVCRGSQPFQRHTPDQCVRVARTRTRLTMPGVRLLCKSLRVKAPGVVLWARVKAPGTRPTPG